MCKAGFAGDDAPRAVFRKLYPNLYTYGMAHPRYRLHGFAATSH